MYKHEHCLTPIKEPLPPPPHTKVHARCFTCKKFPVCNIRADYLKTALLIENILGRPCENLEMHCLHPDFKGIPISFANKYMPEKITTNVDKEGTFFGLKGLTPNKYNFVYGIDKCLMLYSATYVEPKTAFCSDVSDEELFPLLSITDFCYPAVTKMADKTFYHYLPVSCSTYLDNYLQIQEMINSIENGNFTITIPIAFNCVFGNFNKEERYPTEEEIKSNPDLIANSYTKGVLSVPLNKTDIGLSLADKITLKIYSTTDTEAWNNVFKAWDLTYSTENSQKIFTYLNTIVTEGYFEISEGKDLYYKNIKSTISSKNKDEINKALLEIREILLKQQPATKINTTAFSANLNCHFYEWEKGLTEEQGIERLMLKYPKGIPLNDKEYYHLETIHLEPGHVPCYHPYNGTPIFMPMPYPVYIPPKCEHPKHYCTRDEINE